MWLFVVTKKNVLLFHQQLFLESFTLPNEYKKINIFKKEKICIALVSKTVTNRDNKKIVVWKYKRKACIKCTNKMRVRGDFAKEKFLIKGEKIKKTVV